LLGLVLRALNRQACVVHLPADAGGRLTDADLRLRGGVLGLDHFLLRAELLDAGLELLLVRDQLLLLILQLRHLSVEILELLLETRLPLERLPGKVLAARSECLAGLRVELDDVLLELLGLELEPLFGRDDVRDASFHVLQRFQLLLV